MTAIHTHTFRPFRLVDGQCIRSPDAVWQEPVAVQKQALKDNGSTFPLGECPPRPRIRLDCDLFEDFDGPVVDERGYRYWRHPIGQGAPDWECYPASDDVTKFGPWVPVAIADIRTGIFRLFDQTPNCDWLVTTMCPENVRRMWPCYVTPTHMQHRPNVWLGVQASAQDEVDKWMDELSDLVGKAIPGHIEATQ